MRGGDEKSVLGDELSSGLCRAWLRPDSSLWCGRLACCALPGNRRRFTKPPLHGLSCRTRWKRLWTVGRCTTAARRRARSRSCLRIRRAKPTATASRPFRSLRREERTNNGNSTPMHCDATSGHSRRDPDSPAIVPAILPVALRLKRYDEAVRYVLLPGKLGGRRSSATPPVGRPFDPTERLCPGRGRLRKGIGRLR